MEKAIIFCRTKLDCDNLERLFIKNYGGGPYSKNSDFSCVCLHSDRKPNERKSNLERFKKDEVRFLICTDVAARGIDVKVKIEIKVFDLLDSNDLEEGLLDPLNDKTTHKCTQRRYY